VILRFELAARGFVALRLRAQVPGARWDRPGAECAVVQVRLDGAYHQDVILVQGEVEADYERLLGELDAGPHTVEIGPRRDAPPRPEPRILGLDAVPLHPRDAADARALREAPVLYTRAEEDPWESLWTDTPLLLFQRLRDGGVEFQCVFSNEDGGTDTRGLLAQWGRTTDIEWVLHVPDTGEATIQGRHHRTEVHSGQRALGRRTLQVVGRHGMVSSEPPWGVMRCLFVPALRWDDRLPREVCLDAAPWAYRLTALEMARECRLRPGSPAGDPEPGDLRDYLYVQVCRTEAARPPVAVEIRARCADGSLRASTHGDAAQACRRPYAFSTAIKLDRGAEVVALEAAAATPPTAEVRLCLHRAFRLDGDWLPLPALAPTAAAAAWVCLDPAHPEATLWRP